MDDRPGGSAWAVRPMRESPPFNDPFPVRAASPATLQTLAKTLRYGARQQRHVTISDRMAWFLADLLDGRALSLSASSGAA